MEVYKDHFQIFTYDEEKKFVRHSWFTTEGMNDSDFKRCLVQYAEVIDKYRPDFVLSNTQNFVFTITLELQEWSSRAEISKTNEVVKKLAIIVSLDLFAQLSVNQAIDETQSRNTNLLSETQYFDTEEEALKWLFEK